jgi:hypothetical protein
VAPNGLHDAVALDTMLACPHRRVQGWIADNTGRPLAGARVCVPGWGADDEQCQGYVVTDEDGAFAVARPTSGPKSQLWIEYAGAYCEMVMWEGCDETVDLRMPARCEHAP